LNAHAVHDQTARGAQSEPPLRIAMWSGPRNISTAMMRAFENRPDCEVWDEPLYGPYLAATGKAHPGADEVIEAQGSDWSVVVGSILGPVPSGRPLWYQKHMTHHILPDMSLDWVDDLANCFLIRDPAEVLSSYRVRRDEFDVEDLGFTQQLELFRHVVETSGSVPPVLDARDVLENPSGMLQSLCASLGIDFDARMLKWPPGPRDSDGVWGKHWYDAVWKSTGFSPHVRRDVRLDDDARRIVERCRPCYETLRAQRLEPVAT
jgi:hypothetical protein